VVVEKRGRGKEVAGVEWGVLKEQEVALKVRKRLIVANHMCCEVIVVLVVGAVEERGKREGHCRSFDGHNIAAECCVFSGSPSISRAGVGGVEASGGEAIEERSGVT